MANETFALRNAQVEGGGFNQALATASLRISALTTAIETLNLTVSLQRSLVQTLGAGRSSDEGAGTKSTEKNTGRLQPPEMLKPAIAIDSAVADLISIAQLDRSQGAEAAQGSFEIAKATWVAAGGTSALDLVKAEIVAARAGVVSDIPDASARQTELQAFASDAAVTAPAYQIPALEVAEMMAAWRTSMKLTREQALDLADATNHLGKLPGGARAADVGAVLQRSGGAAVSAGLQPEHAAALSAALLNTGTSKDQAGVALNRISAALNQGDNASAPEKAAWLQLGIKPQEFADLMRNKDDAPGALMSVLAALNAKPAEQRSAVATMLFGNSDAAALGLARNLGDVNEAFSQIKDSRQYATSRLGNEGSVRQSAQGQSETQRGQWNVLNARNDRLSTVTGNALAPPKGVFDIAGSAVDGLSDLAQTFPKTTAALALAAAALAPLFKAVVAEMTSQAAKWVVGGVAARLPGRLGGIFSEAAVAKTRSSAPDSSTPVRAPLRSGPSVRVSTRGSRSTVPRLAGTRLLTSRLPGPLRAIGAVTDVAEGVLSGDRGRVGAGLGAAGGGWAGAASGAALGATVGSVVPIIGTALGGLLGGLIGGWAGSEAGASLGEKLATPAPDRLAPPAEVSKDLGSTQTQNQPITYAPSIQVNCSDPGSSEQIGQIIAQQLQAQFSTQFSPLMNTNALATRRDAALTDGVA